MIESAILNLIVLISEDIEIMNLYRNSSENVGQSSMQSKVFTEQIFASLVALPLSLLLIYKLRNVFCSCTAYLYHKHLEN